MRLFGASMRLGAWRAVVRRRAPLCVGTAVLLLLASVHVRTAGSMVEILEPVDGSVVRLLEGESAVMKFGVNFLKGRCNALNVCVHQCRV